MIEKEISFHLKVYDNDAQLSENDKLLIERARAALKNAYAPYSNFNVAAAVLLQNGEILTGTNQENAAFPVGICAEGTVLSAASAVYPDVQVKKIAITVKSPRHTIQHPVAPCGICRQRLLEYENRFGQPIQIIMQGETGVIYIVNTVKDLLPLYFSNKEL